MCFLKLDNVIVIIVNLSLTITPVSCLLLQVGDVILQLNASDPDKAENGRLTYLISQGEISSLLVVDENTGTVRAVDVFNFEKIKV